MRGVVLFLKRLIRNYSQLVLLALSEVWLEGLNGVYRQPSKKPLIFYRQPSKSQSNINRQNVSGYFKSHYFDEILAPEESLHLKKPRAMLSKTHTLSLSLSLNITRPYNLKYLQIVFVKDQGYLQNTTVKY